MRHQRVTTFASSHCICAIHLYSLPSSLLLGLMLLLLTNANYFVSGSYEDDEGYCRLCERHTMCLFPYDDAGSNCMDLENSHLYPDEIRSIVHQHNVHRNNIAEGLEQRGNPGPQPRVSHMMEFTWDNELARLARRWVIQCKPFEKDACRDVERFAVWQNINTIILDATYDPGDEEPEENRDYGLVEDEHSAVTTSPFMRIPLHIQTWLDEVIHFDNSDVGLVNYAVENGTSYLAIAGGMITRVGCGRAIYRAHLHTTFGSGSNSRVEVLVCNYGPIDRTAPHDLYDATKYVPCPEGTVESHEFDHLCTKSPEVRGFPHGDLQDHAGEEGTLDSGCHCTDGPPSWEERRRKSIGSSAVSIALRKSTSVRSNFQALAKFLSLGLFHIITRTYGVHCC